MSYCSVRSPVKHLYLLLGELNTIADMSLASGHPKIYSVVARAMFSRI